MKDGGWRLKDGGQEDRKAKEVSLVRNLSRKLQGRTLSFVVFHNCWLLKKTRLVNLKLRVSFLYHEIYKTVAFCQNFPTFLIFLLILRFFKNKLKLFKKNLSELKLDIKS